MNEWFEFRDLIWLIMTYYYDLMLRKFEKHLMPLDTMAPGTPFAAVSQTTGVSFGNMTSCPWLDRPWPAHLSRNSFLKPCGNNPRVPRGHDWITCGYLWFVADQHLLRWMLSWYLLEFLWPSNSFWYPKEMLHLFGDDTQSGCLWPMAIRLVFRRTGPGIEVNDGSWGVLKTCDAIYSIGLSIYQFINRLFYISIYLYLSLSISIYLSLSTSIYLPLSIYLSIFLSFYIFLYIFVSVYLYLYVFIYRIWSYLFLSYLSIYIYFHLPAPSQRQRWGGNPREQHPRRSCPWRCAAGFPVSPRTRQQGLDSSWPIHSWFLSKNGSVKSCRLEDDDFLYIIWTTIALDDSYISYSQCAGQLVCAQQFHQVYVCLMKKVNLVACICGSSVLCHAVWSNQQWTE